MGIVTTIIVGLIVGALARGLLPGDQKMGWILTCVLGIAGSAIAWGVKRGIFSNEAGQGTGPQAAAAAEVAHPAQQGLVQAFSVYVDTLGVCTATGLMVLLTGQYNVADGKGGYLAQLIPGVEHGPLYTQRAVDTVLPGFGPATAARLLDAGARRGPRSLRGRAIAGSSCRGSRRGSSSASIRRSWCCSMSSAVR